MFRALIIFIGLAALGVCLLFVLLLDHFGVSHTRWLITGEVGSIPEGGTFINLIM